MGSVLVLGGTAWLGREVARAAQRRGHEVTCLARGEAGTVADGVRFVRADRSAPGAYEQVQHTDWDDVVDVSWQPGQVRSAVAALADRAAHWTYVSSCSVYADHSIPGVDESAALLEPWPDDVAGAEVYGEAKVACEQAVLAGLGDRALLARAGLIGGFGDGSDRFGYWVSRFRLAGEGEVLVPDAPEELTQTIDVQDLADWLMRAGEQRSTGPVNAVGEARRLLDVIATARDVAAVGGRRATMVPADGQWLRDNTVEEWAGPRSLPLWLWSADTAGFGARSDARAMQLGLARRPLDETLADALAHEEQLGLDRERRAGLSRADELELLEALRQ